MKILLVGPMPAPVGGVSIHIQRLQALLLSLGCEVSLIDESPKKKEAVFNIRSLNFASYIKLFLSADIVHIHSSLFFLRIIHLLFCIILKKRYVVTLHSWRNVTTLSFYFQVYFLSRAMKVICVNSEIQSTLGLSNTMLLPAFLPPDMTSQKQLPKYICDWIKERRKVGSFILSSNAYRLDEHDGFDLYGLDMALSMIEKLNYEKDIDISLVFSVANLHLDDKKFTHYKSVVKKCQYADKILLIHEPGLSFVRLIEASDATLRATNTDGDALSVRESLYLQTPVIASDAAKRPDGTYLFKSRDVDDLCFVIAKILREAGESRLGVYHCDDYIEVYKSIYHIN